MRKFSLAGWRVAEWAGSRFWPKRRPNPPSCWAEIHRRMAWQGERKTCHHRCFALMVIGQPYLMPKPAFSLSWPEAHATAWTVSLNIVIFYPRAVLLIKENFCIMRDSRCIEVLLSGNEFSISHELSQLLMLICVCDLPKLFLFTMLLWNI